LPTRADLDDAAKEEALEAARKGMSFEGVAHVLGVSRQCLGAIRKRDPDFNADLLRALAKHELDLLDTINAGLADAKTAGLASVAHQVLSRRFPQRHGADPRLRLTAQQAAEGYEDDLNDPNMNPAVESTAAVIGRLVDRMLTEDEAKDA
jgi:hypothetical protein